MRRFQKFIFAGAVGIALAGPGTAFGWGDSFSFGDSWNPGVSRSSWSTPNWGTSYSSPNWSRRGWNQPGWGGPAYYPPPRGHYYPRPSAYDRTQMKDNRQRLMSNHDDAMDSLADMLYGKFRFDREDAIQEAREIVTNSGQIMLHNFHPGAIATSGSYAAPTFWGNEEAFKSYADVMKAAAEALATELEKRPTAEEGAMYPRRSRGFDYSGSSDGQDEPISPQVFTKFHELASTCQACHGYFRLRKW